MMCNNDHDSKERWTTSGVVCPVSRVETDPRVLCHSHGALVVFWGPWMIIGGENRDELSGLTSDKWAAAHDRPNGAASIGLPTMR